MVGTCKVKLLSSTSATSRQILNGTVELRLAYDTTLTESKNLIKIAKLKMFIKTLKFIFAFGSL